MFKILIYTYENNIIKKKSYKIFDLKTFINIINIIINLVFMINKLFVCNI